MTAENTVLVMAGAGEAPGVVAGLRAQGRRVAAILPEPARNGPAMEPSAEVRRFAGDAEFAGWLAEHRIGAVIDASHAFDAGVVARTARVCAARGLPRLRLLRPAWQPGPGDRWTPVRDVADAAAHVPPGARAFSNTGRGTERDYAGFGGEVLFLRQTEVHEGVPPFGFIRYVHGQPPFSQDEEEALFRELAIDLLICRNTGGGASRSKLLAARALGLPVLMIKRPAAPDGPRAETVDAALDWAARL